MFAIIQSGIRFAKHRAGSVAPAFALSLLPLTLAAGGAIDFAHAKRVKAQLQGALDGAVLGGAKDGSANWAQTAQNLFQANGSRLAGLSASASFSASGTTYSGNATATVPTNFLGIINMSSLTVGAKSEAMAGTAGDSSCLLALDKGDAVNSNGVTLNGAPNVSLAGCTIKSNTSMTCNGHGGNAYQSIATGTVSGCSNPTQAAATPDTYASLASNISTVCGAAVPGATWTGGALPTSPNIVTVSKGGFTEYHVCGTLTLSGTGYLTGSAPASDSIIVVENGGITLAANAAINTVRTTIVLTGNNSYGSSITFPNGKGHGATLALSPSTDATNPWRGVSLYQDPALTNSVADSWGPGATFNADGVVYLPNADVTISGSSASNNSQCTKLVVKTFRTNGSVDLTFAQSATGCASIGLQQYAGTALRLSL